MAVEWTITIQKCGHNDYRVAWGSQCVEHLCWDEMLGQVARMTVPKDHGELSDGLPSLFHPKPQPLLTKGD